MPKTLPTKLRNFAASLRSVSYNGAAGQKLNEAVELALEAANVIEALDADVEDLTPEGEGPYKVAHHQNGFAVVLDHNGYSIIGVHQTQRGALTPCFSSPMGDRVARLLNANPGDPVGVMDEFGSDTLLNAKPEGTA